MRGYFGVGVEGISKSYNLGAVLRTSNAFGASFAFTICALALYDRTIMMGGYPERPVKVGGPEEGWVKPKSKR